MKQSPRRQLMKMQALTVILCLSLLLKTAWTRHSPNDAQNTCGKSQRSFRPERLTLEQGGETCRRGDFPWMVALYYRMDGEEWSQICGGTLISSRLVVTAAHCLSVSGRDVEAADLRVWLGKLYSDYDRDEPSSVKSHVKELVRPERYRGDDNDYELDIALLVLSQSVASSEYIMPACVDWDSAYVPNGNDVGYLAGWGSTEKGTPSPSPVLMWASQKYVEYNRCMEMVDSVDRKLITQDKICVAEVSGAVGERRDSGGGFTIVRDGAHHLYGVLSTKLNNESIETNLRLFTNVLNNDHLNWLRKNYDRLQQSSDGGSQNNFYWPGPGSSCWSGYFQCGTGVCIPSNWLCDGYSDCKDNSDEYNCGSNGGSQFTPYWPGLGSSCWSGYFQCGTGWCIPSHFTCDGYNNCGDNSNEWNCVSYRG